jgi:membrane-bound ClpP family serine protease
MNDRHEISTLKAWLLVLASLLDEAILLALIFLALRLFHVDITWPIILVVVLVIIVYFFIIHKAVIPSLKSRKTTGAEGMIGLIGTVTRALKPEGVIQVNGEYWQTKSIDGDINKDEDVEVVGINGLILEVKRKKL